MRFATISLIILLLIIGCSSRSNDLTKDGRKIVDYWTPWTGFEKQALDEAVAAFNASQNKIFVKTLSITDPKTKIMLATASGHPPDIAQLPYYYLPAYAENNALTPIAKLCEEHGINEMDFIPIFWESGSYRNVQWAIPFTGSVTAMYYNKELFREAGLDPEKPPKTLEELEAMNEALTRFREDGSIERIGHLPTQPGWWRTSWGRWFGGSSFNGDDQMLIDSSPWKKTGEWIASYPDRFGADKLIKLKSGFGKFASPQNPFFVGKVAIVHQGIWMDNFIRRYASEDFEYGLAAFPASEKSGIPFVTIGEADVVSIPNGAKHKKEAMIFIKYLTRQEVLEELSLKHRKMTTLKAVSETFLQDHPHPFIETFVELADSPYAKNRVMIPHYIPYQTDMTVAIDAILYSRSSIEDALKSAQDRQQDVLEKQLRRWHRVADARMTEWGYERN